MKNILEMNLRISKINLKHFDIIIILIRFKNFFNNLLNIKIKIESNLKIF